MLIIESRMVSIFRANRLVSFIYMSYWGYTKHEMTCHVVYYFTSIVQNSTFSCQSTSNGIKQWMVEIWMKRHLVSDYIWKL